MPLFETIKIDKEKIKNIVKDNWDLDLGDCIKESQNHTFSAERGNDKFIVRVTPDPKKQRIECTELETSLLQYLSNDISVCPSVENKDGKLMLVVDDLIICVFKYAKGDPVNYVEWKWLNKNVVNDLGTWFGKLHKLTRQFSKEYPEISSKARHWTTLHDSILKDVPVDERDNQTSKDPNKFTIIHGDVNPSNYFWSESEGICMFDWDQTQLSWLLYDLSAPIFGVWVLEKKGSPIDGKILPEFNSQQYTDYLLETYEPIFGEKVCRESLSRMVDIRKQLYVRFCRAAIHELEESSPMYKFCKGMNDFFETLGIN
ncbi:hypothetical protein DICPUDRAFT_155334 [Dictyostelium purpureum]|uniref:Aminoglycoside phosphotransferase domain-containing protein n=1 Tax=Dictyostelium purpureum TaxID=5786 RepID=F0ZTQ5_DICPU|nr:uncharacterized protein DICPUDRAFT_155334 [Dictyostelium purpureum]EGC32666.1 hypothetical protein DICPUDRAFT_155334 [Dictyostelium purpureum]|eukprot:XP_003290799.1 hypothetical protein DICPUDRAFT_155334 [Dictyostelium purpureum]